MNKIMINKEQLHMIYSYIYLILSSLFIALFIAVLHLWTVIIAFSTKGFIAAALTFLFPIFAEMFWFIKIGNDIGYNSFYCISIIIYISFLILHKIFHALVIKKHTLKRQQK